MAEATKRASRTAMRENPRLSARRESVAASKRRRRRRIAALGACIIVAGVGLWYLLHSAVFSAKTIIVRGARHESASQVIDAAGLQGHPPLISISSTTAAEGVETLPWVATASVRTQWPRSVTITVTERTPVATAAIGGHVMLIDATGRVLATSATPPDGSGAVAVSAPGLKMVPAGSWVGLSGAAAIKVAATLPPAFRGQVAKVVEHRDGTLTLVMTSPITIQMGNSSQLGAKYQDIASIIAGTTLHPGDVVDVSVPQSSTVSGP